MPTYSYLSRIASVIRLGALVRVLAFWTGWFVLARLLFLLYEGRQARSLDASLLAGLWAHGLRMDLSAAAYLTIIPWLLLVFLGQAGPRTLQRVMTLYFGLALAFTSLVTVADLQLFVAWRFRLDASLIQFLRTPGEALASSASSPWIRLTLLLIALFAGTWRLSWAYVIRPLGNEAPAGLRSALVTAALGTLLLIPIRGGLQWTPMNPSFAYFSNNDFANQAALNASWHFVHATVAAAQEPAQNPYRMLAPSEARAVVDSMFRTAAGRQTPLLRIARPNIILIVWESLTSKVVARLGGVPGVTPQFERLTHHGILFDSLFASAGRTPQGMVALLSAFPALPHQEILDLPRVAATLPMLGKSLGDAGWRSSFYYGGELEFANLRSYTSLGRYGRVVSVGDFLTRDRNSKWGAHDHVVLRRALDDLSREARPFFSTVLTLSSHEPFEVPETPTFPGTSEDTLFLNAHHYTDASIGAFIDAAQRQPWWDSTLVVIVADHGSPRPAPDPIADERVPDRYHIPMLWLGGALALRDTVIHTVGSQMDVAPTVLAQLGQDGNAFAWGKDLSARDARGFAYFAYHDGFAFIDSRGWVVYDELAHRTVQSGGHAVADQQRLGSAMLQASFDDLLTRRRYPARGATAGR